MATEKIARNSTHNTKDAGGDRDDRVRAGSRRLVRKKGGLYSAPSCETPRSKTLFFRIPTPSPSRDPRRQQALRALENRTKTFFKEDALNTQKKKKGIANQRPHEAPIRRRAAKSKWPPLECGNVFHHQQRHLLPSIIITRFLFFLFAGFRFLLRLFSPPPTHRKATGSSTVSLASSRPPPTTRHFDSLHTAHTAAIWPPRATHRSYK